MRLNLKNILLLVLLAMVVGFSTYGLLLTTDNGDVQMIIAALMPMVGACAGMICAAI